MPSSSDNDGTPNRRRRSGSRGRARVSITTTDNHTNNTGSHEADPSSAVLTPASSASDLRQVRTVRTGDTTVPTGAHTRGGAGSGNDNSSNTANLTGGLGSPNSHSTGNDGPSSQQLVGEGVGDVVVGPSPSYQSMGAGTQATATAGGLLYSALGTIKEWTNDIANDLMAVDNNNKTNANRSSSGNRNMEGGGNHRDGNQSSHANDNNTNDNKKKTSSPGRKLRDAVVRSLSPNGRRGSAKNAQQQQSLRVTGTNPCGPALSQVMDDFVQATTMDGDVNNNNANTNKPMSKMRQKLVKSTTKSGTNRSNKAISSRSRGRNDYSLNGSELLGIQQGQNTDGIGVGGGDSTVVARTNPRNDNNTNGKNKNTKTATNDRETKPQIIGPVQFLQHMMSTNCMAGTDLAELGFGGGDSDDDDDGSSYEDSSSEDESDYSDTTGHSSGRNRRQQSSSGRRAQQQQRRSGSRRSGGS